MSRVRALTAVSVAALALVALGTPGASARLDAAVQPPVRPLMMYSIASKPVHVARIPLATLIPDPPIPLYATTLNMSPDGRTLYAVGAAVTSIDTTTNTIGRTVPLPSIAALSAMTPDGRKLWLVVTGTPSSLVPFNTATGRLGTSIPLPGLVVKGMVLAPDASMAYLLANDDLLVPVDLANGRVGTAAVVGAHTGEIVLVPGSSTAFVAVFIAPGGLGIIPVVLPTLRTLPVIRLQSIYPQLSMALSPDGKTVWVSLGHQDAPRSGAIVGIDPTTNTASVSWTLKEVNGPIGISPDGSSAHVIVRVGRYVVTTMLLATGAITSSVPVGRLSCCMMFTPGQAPTAAAAAVVGPHGSATTLDGSASVGVTGPIVRWAWDFGDGTKAVTTVPTAQHVYAVAGTYTVKLNVTDSTNTSNLRVFDGKNVLRNGRPSAVTRTTVVIR